MLRREDRYKAFIDYFKKHMPEPTTELVYRNPFELLIAVILSAQCTDKRVNQVTPALFEAFPSPEALALADVDVVLHYIRSISYPNSKAKYLVETAKRIVNVHGGELPDTREELEQLRGVGRKTANVMLATVYKQPAIAVDTHVMRVSKRLGLVSDSARTTRAIEAELMHFVPKEEARHLNHWLVLFGRYRCTATNPACGGCPFRDDCVFFQTQRRA